MLKQAQEANQLQIEFVVEQGNWHNEFLPMTLDPADTDMDVEITSHIFTHGDIRYTFYRHQESNLIFAYALQRPGLSQQKDFRKSPTMMDMVTNMIDARIGADLEIAEPCS